jgi:DNA repair exonuclease SbcCD ATPase subunit
MFKIKNLTVKNFLSVGQNTQAVKFDTCDLVLVLGENIDLGGDDSGSRNGTGKTTVLNALSYALYGQALTNIRKENLINKTNGKGLLVTVDFEVNGKSYRVERGRKPNVFKFFIDSEELAANDESQGDSRETQHAIDELLGMTHDMFRHLVALNTYTEPFLSLKANDQRMIIEQLLGITLLSEKADRLREQMRVTKDLATQEEQRIRAVTSANARIQDQILSLQRRQRMWQEKHLADVAQLQLMIDQLNQINIEQEISLHEQWREFRNYQQTRNQLSQAKAQQVSFLQKEIRSFDRLERELQSLQNNQCYTCGQPVKNLDQQIADKTAAIAESQQTVQQLESEILQLDLELAQLTVVSEPSETFYPDRETATEHRINLQTMQTQLVAKQSETDPYQEQITEMSTQALEEICYDTINALKRVQEHEEFLLKLLTNKDSFVRKKIIDQNLSYLNQRLSYYLYKMGLPHRVIFQSDLSVQIEELGRELDFDNLSRGERNRLILSLSWSFRDVWESLYHPVNLMFIDEMIDNGMDSSGVENAMGILKHMARDRQRSVWLISHKDELASRVNNVLKVVKENGFTQYLQEMV